MLITNVIVKFLRTYFKYSLSAWSILASKFERETSKSSLQLQVTTQYEVVDRMAAVGRSRPILQRCCPVLLFDSRLYATKWRWITQPLKTLCLQKSCYLYDDLLTQKTCREVGIAIHIHLAPLSVLTWHFVVSTLHSVCTVKILGLCHTRSMLFSFNTILIASRIPNVRWCLHVHHMYYINHKR